MKTIIVTSVFLGLGIAGCTEPPYRYEVHDTGEGSIQIDEVPKTPGQMVATTPAQVPAPTAMQSATDQQRIDELEAKVRALSDENQKLKQAMPTTAPAKE